MKINLKSRQAWFVILLTIVLGGSYFYIMSHISGNVDKLEQEVEQLSAKHKELEKRGEKRAQIEKEIKTNRIELDRLNSLLPTEIRQEDIILSFNSLKRTSGIQFINLSFSGVKKIEGAVDQNKANTTAKAKTPGAKGEEGIPDLTGLETEVSSNFTSNYEQLKQFMRDVDNHRSRVVIKKLNLKSSEEIGISGSMSLKFYGFSDKAQSLDYLDLEVNRGKNNPLQ